MSCLPGGVPHHVAGMLEDNRMRTSRAVVPDWSSGSGARILLALQKNGGEKKSGEKGNQ